MGAPRQRVSEGKRESSPLFSLELLFSASRPFSEQQQSEELFWHTRDHKRGPQGNYSSDAE